MIWTKPLRWCNEIHWIGLTYIQNNTRWCKEDIIISHLSESKWRFVWKKSPVLCVQKGLEHSN